MERSRTAESPAGRGTNRPVKAEVAKITDVKMHLLQAREGSRPAVMERVQQLAESIAKIGLQYPIIVRSGLNDSPGEIGVMEILAGRHRYEAFRLLGKHTIPAIIVDINDLQAELIGIDENLCRQDLSPAEEAAAIARRKEIYDLLNPQATHGGDRKSTRQNGDLKASVKQQRFTKVTAETTGKPERSVQRAARRGKRIGSKNLNRITRTSLDKASELDALLALPTVQQEALIERAVKGECVSARQPTSQTLSESWRGEFRRLIAKVPSNDDREWVRTTFPQESCGHRLNRAEPVQAEAPRAEMDTPTASGCE
jgi:ParB/RepB/Spo0J family partition protein